MIRKVLAQDVECHCVMRINNHDQYHMWGCLQSAGRLYLQLIKSTPESKEAKTIV